MCTVTKDQDMNAPLLNV